MWRPAITVVTELSTPVMFPVTGGHQSLRLDLRRISCCRNANPLQGLRWAVSTGFFGREDAMVCSCARQVGDRGDLHQLGGRSRRQADRSKHLSSADSSWEYLMSNSPKSANSVTRLYGVPGRALDVGLRDRRDIVHDGLMRAPRLDGADVRPRPSVMPAMMRPDRQDSASWSSPILAFFMEGFALYGASYCGSRHAMSPADTSAAAASAPEPEESSWRARRRAMAIVSSAMRSGPTEVGEDANRAWPGPDRDAEIRRWISINQIPVIG
jgi:hypothetical protein